LVEKSDTQNALQEGHVMQGVAQRALTSHDLGEDDVLWLKDGVIG